jgi:hypothetical protein
MSVVSYEQTEAEYNNDQAELFHMITSLPGYYLPSSGNPEACIA